ncbi:hypothetical protein DACRYDRAFT_20747 [Dacryopinax primogenitus]|uniref:Uncharacterized protein n=1 Tax=Dacryopinax primogenitus (strain DJM 731) TaxID=1858805 RepID=M5G1L6_DACPD|nr:uncharacterized protein DACRYDRAFT_20747 [Dacryopinax primogenitus]EJU04111.1 hypothetical protein DACRYDRAFT_20747 [Dacryopinax primogenitus]
MGKAACAGSLLSFRASAGGVAYVACLPAECSLARVINTACEGLRSAQLSPGNDDVWGYCQARQIAGGGESGLPRRGSGPGEVRTPWGPRFEFRSSLGRVNTILISVD